MAENPRTDNPIPKQLNIFQELKVREYIGDEPRSQGLSLRVFPTFWRSFQLQIPKFAGKKGVPGFEFRRYNHLYNYLKKPFSVPDCLVDIDYLRAIPSSNGIVARLCAVF